jgi:tryptophan synthase beta chain
MNNKTFTQSFKEALSFFSGRPTPIYHASRLSRLLGCAYILFKREDLGSTGSHKVNNVIGQVLIAREMKKKRLIAETGAGQHGVAVSTLATKYGFTSTIYMGHNDAKRQMVNVKRMKSLGANVKEVGNSTCDLREALSEAIRDWIINVKTTFYVLGTASGPFPYPTIVKAFQRVIGDESWVQVQALPSRTVDIVVACVGGGSNSIGTFFSWLKSSVVLIGVEAAGENKPFKRCSASLNLGSPGILHGTLTYILQNQHGQVERTHSISAGLDYPGVGPEHAFFKDSFRATYSKMSDDWSLRAFVWCSRVEGITPALESCHAIAFAVYVATCLTQQRTLLVNLSGSGEKDVSRIIKHIQRR